ncbi:hypothetical protein J437_LFUL007949 [Ladona fulva]|uniref:Uncharacterized protein n=1 Tax=Ladona fulva TaxID=123851 RepID=A0A8K0KDA2_LADFU|nr:hypothetical protein J437_LFUL007949 [Ladona fulva]
MRYVCVTTIYGILPQIRNILQLLKKRQHLALLFHPFSFHPCRRRPREKGAFYDKSQSFFLKPYVSTYHLPGTSTATGTPKRRKVRNIKSSSAAAQLALAASLNLRVEGDTAAAQRITEVTTTTPTRARRVLSKWRKFLEAQAEMSPEDALSLMISTELTKSQYNALRCSALSY